jgi:hypothetical protein
MCTNMDYGTIHPPTDDMRNYLLPKKAQFAIQNILEQVCIQNVVKGGSIYLISISLMQQQGSNKQ